MIYTKEKVGPPTLTPYTDNAVSSSARTEIPTPLTCAAAPISDLLRSPFTHHDKSNYQRGSASDRQVCGHAKWFLRLPERKLPQGLPVCVGGPSPPLRRIGRPKPKSPSLCPPSWLVRRSKRLCGSGREERYALPRTLLKCQSSRDQGSLEVK
jgi:hypothetical protein